MSSGRTSRSEPLKARPMGVRTVSMITASGISDSCLGGGKRQRFPLLILEKDLVRSSRPARGPPASWNGPPISFVLLGGLFRWHPKRAIQPDGFPVEHRILSDVARK